MAVTATHLETANEETDLNSYTTGSISPSADKLILAFVTSNIGSGSPNEPTLSGNGLTWVSVRTVTIDTIIRATLFRAMGSSPSAGSVTIDFGGETQSRCHWTIAEFGGVDTGGTNGSAALVQSASNTATSGTSITITLGAFASATNATYGGILKQAAEDISPGTGFTELGEVDAVFAVESQWKNSSDTGVDWSWSSGAVRVGGIAAEIAEAPAVGGDTGTLDLNSKHW